MYRYLLPVYPACAAPMHYPYHNPESYPEKWQIYWHLWCLPYDHILARWPLAHHSLFLYVHPKVSASESAYRMNYPAPPTDRNRLRAAHAIPAGYPSYAFQYASSRHWLSSMNYLQPCWHWQTPHPGLHQAPNWFWWYSSGKPIVLPTPQEVSIPSICVW